MDQEKYYTIASEASQEIQGHPGLEYLQKEVGKVKNILDIGCGEGSKLNSIVSNHQNATGIDVSRYAINLAKKKYPQFNFIYQTNKKLPFKDWEFELVYSTFVLEHTQDHRLFLQEMIRVLKTKGKLVILCPNFGSPNRRSRYSVERPIKKLIKGFLKDFSPSNLDWVKVKPKKKYLNIDDDTTVEPFLKDLKGFFQKNGFKILKYSSLWSLEPFSLNPRKLLFTFLGKLGIFPFKYWGPQIFITIQKR